MGMGCQLNDLIEDYKELSPKEARKLIRNFELLKDELEENTAAANRLAYALEQANRSAEVGK